jgi:hypothetical protein
VVEAVSRQLVLSEPEQHEVMEELAPKVKSCECARIVVEMTNKESQQKEPQKPKEPQDKVLDLINWVEENKSKIRKTYDGARPEFFLALIFLIGALVTVGYAVHDFLVSISIVPVSLVALVAFFSFAFQGIEKRRWIKRFERALKLRSFDDREKALLKALIKIKSVNEEINLKTLYEVDKEVNGDIFTEKNLLKILAEP